MYIVGLLRSVRCDLSSEQRAQADIEAVLKARKVPFKREARLADADRPDFVVLGDVVVECKLRGKFSKMDIYRQLHRYAQHDQINAIVLATNSPWALDEVSGKPILVASLSQGWM